MSDTRVLLGQIRELRLRLAQVHGGNIYGSPYRDVLLQPDAAAIALTDRTADNSNRQALLESAVQHMTAEVGSQNIRPRQLIASVRHQLERGRQIVGRLKQLAQDPFLLKGDGAANSSSDPLLTNFRETSVMVESSLRLVQAFPDNASDQIRLGEGLENILHAIDDRLTTLIETVASQGGENEQRDQLAELLEQLHSGKATDPAPFLAIAGAVLQETRSGAPLRLVHAHPKQVARFVAAHSISCARIAARMIKYDAEWQRHASEAVVAALLKDIGMLNVSAEILSEKGSLSDEHRRLIEAHAECGAELVARHLPARATLCEAIVSHHERLDGTGYPNGLKASQIGRLPRLLALADVYAAMCEPRPHRSALDSRTALAETLQMAEKGLMDRDMAQRLLQLSMYPVGAVVELSDGAIAAVVAVHSQGNAVQSATKPVLAILTDTSHKLLPSPKHVDLAESNGRSVRRALTEQERRDVLGRKYPEYV